MPGPRAPQIILAPPVRRRLLMTARSGIAQFRDVQRARIILLAARGMTSAEITRRLGCNETTVRKWRKRFRQQQSTASLDDKSRSGRPPRVSVATRCEVIKLACRRPADNRAPFRDIWTLASLRDALDKELSVSLSCSELRRILRAEGLRPHKMRLWLHSPDPHFRDKVRRICDLYRQPPPGATVLC